jgi:hypothetical protein
VAGGYGESVPREHGVATRLNRCGVLLSVVLVLSAAACGSEEGSVEVVNDLGRRVELLQCSNDLCTGDYHLTGVMEPGRSFTANVSTIGVPNPWLVRELDGERLGCLPLVMPEPTEGVVARVSQYVPCQKKYDESELWPPLATAQ